MPAVGSPASVPSMPPSAESAVADFRTRAAALERAGLPVSWAGPAAGEALAEAVRLGADGERLLEAAVATGQDAAARARGAWRPWFYPALVCAGAAIGAAVLSVVLAPVFERVYAEFRVAPGSGLGFLESARAAAGWLAAAAAAALLVAWWAATVWQSRLAPHDPLRTALACETLAALADAGVAPDRAEGMVRGIGAEAGAVPFAAWAGGDDLGGVPRGEALRLAALVARARAARADGEDRRFARIVASVVLAGLAVFAYALVLFLPAIDFFRAVSDASASYR
mgnify:CR=1 FL=1